MLVHAAAGALLLFCLLPAAAAQQTDYAQYVESIQVLLNDDAGTGSASTVFWSSDTKDVTLPDSLVRDLTDHPRILAVLLTNADGCVPGVVEETCLAVNVARIPEETNIILVQDGTRAVADQFIARLNDALGLEAEFHSAFVHFNSVESDRLGVSGLAMLTNTVSVVYTIPHDTTASLYERMVPILLSADIAGGGGFVDAGRQLSSQNGSFFLFLLSAEGANSQMQLRVTRSYNDTLTESIDPLERMGIDAVTRSSYFDDGFYPLNSLIRVAIASDAAPAVSGAASTILAVNDGAPEDMGGRGWFFDPPAGTLIRGTYLMGEEGSVAVGQTEISLDTTAGAAGSAPDGAEAGQEESAGTAQQETAGAPGDASHDSPPNAQDEILVVVAVVIAGVGAAAFYLKGYRR